VDVWTGVGTFERRLFAIRVGVSLLLVAPLGYAFWWLGGFGGADAKAVMVLALLFPTYPTLLLPAGVLPAEQATLGVFSLTVLSNTVVVGVTYPLVLAARNALRGRFALPMFVGRPVAVEDLTDEYGRLLETEDGFSRGGLDLDALRMYLRWRGTTLAALRADPEGHRDPTTLPPPEERGDPGDGAIRGGAPADPDGAGDAVPDGGSAAEDVAGGEDDTDEWGAEAFLGDVEGSAYGTTPGELRAGLDLVAEREVVWISPGIPFLVPTFVGLVVALTFGDLLFAGLAALGLA
jgi:preflagellin peptidase FlaK